MSNINNSLVPSTAFNKAGVDFLKALDKNNNRVWFKENSHTYEMYLLEPLKDLVEFIGEKLKSSGLQIIADPVVDRSVYRIYKDVRFSKDKLPYKNYAALLWWATGCKRANAPGFYFQLNVDGWLCGTGACMFTEQSLKEYRNALVDKKKGSEFNKIVTSLQKLGFSLEGKALKKVPKGFSEDELNAQWLKYKGIEAIKKEKDMSLLLADGSYNLIWENFEKTINLYKWFENNISEGCKI